MEPRDRDVDKQDSEEQKGSDPSPGGGNEADDPRSPAGAQVIGTDDPKLIPKPASNPDWLRHPDQTMAIETSRIRGPSEAFQPNFVMVPVEVETPKNGRSHSIDKTKKKEEKGEDEQDDDREGKDAEAKKAESGSGQDRDKDKGKSSDRPKDKKAETSSHAPSLTRILIFSGIVALVCGLVGAWGYSYFFGSSKNGDQKSAGKSSGSGSNKGSDSSQGSESETSQNDEDQGKVHQAESAWMTAVQELHAAQASEKAARRSEDEAKSILSFFKRTLMSAGRPVDASLAEAFWAGGPSKDVSFRKAVDVTESQVGETFADRPLAEASVREMLGLAYLALGDPAEAVKQYERAFALRQAMQGVNDPETAACRNQLAVAYRLTGRTAEGGRLFDRSPNSPAYASMLEVRGSMLLAQKKPVEAELKLRECLTIREKAQPNDWTTFDTKSLLGEALRDQNKLVDAEPLLLSGYEGMKIRIPAIPPQDKPHVTRAIQRLVRLYEIWGKEAEAVRWRKELDATSL